MATLCISNTLWTNTLTLATTSRLFSSTSASASSGFNTLGQSGGASSLVRLVIYKGTMPADFLEFTDTAQRSADVLITFALPTTNSYVDLGNVGNVSRRFMIARNPTNQAATASGVATWFTVAPSFSATFSDKAALMGSVGLPGSGADLIIPNTNITAGVNYQSSGLVINFPYLFNV